ncbi:3-hydroxylacyl-ACP dehydratase [Roseateles sp. BYS180W]|uniref:3-hydroxylacyl-ACP dehydratase n=1 Tax=Roseateles rivi TaxID=3299028 RepID=A0ABW7FQY3_9BURK
MTPEASTDWAAVPLDELIPHRQAMRLLSRVVQCEGERLVAEADITPEHLFLNSDPTAEGVGAWVGIELMAQAVAAWAGVQRRAREGGEPRVGLLLGTRRYRCTLAHFALGQCLQVHVERQYQADNGLGQFACSIWLQGSEVAQAQLTVFEPSDIQEFLSHE